MLYHRSRQPRELADWGWAGHAAGVTEVPTDELPIDLAATVVVLRDTHAGPEVLLMRRSSKLVFHGGAWVFPGGRVDPADRVQDDVVATARLAAVREAQEEASLTLDPARLLAISHWTTPRGKPRRFATWFFATVLDTHVDVVVDGGEIHAHRWLRPDGALRSHSEGQLELPPPTFVTLTLLSRFASCSQALAHFERTAPPVYVPKQRTHSDGLVSLYHGDVAYEGGELEQPGPRHRLLMLNRGWQYERD